MNIKFVEIQNFRKLKSIRIELSDKTTLFVGANNSGKTSAMVALRYFLVDQNRFDTNDFTLSNWTSINKIGTTWEESEMQSDSPILSLTEWESVLPSMDVWLQVAKNEIHHVSRLLPTLNWDGELLGVRLRLEPKKIEEFYKEYISARKSAKETVNTAKLTNEGKYTVALWPAMMDEFLAKRLNNLFTVRNYSLDPTKLIDPDNGVACPQPLPLGSDPIEGDPFKGLIRIDVIDAQRGFSDASSVRGGFGSYGEEIREFSDKRPLSAQLQSYYTKHIDPSEMPEPSDVDALQAIFEAQIMFDEKLKKGFGTAFEELENLNYPGITDPKLSISTRFKPMDGLNHPSALQYEVLSNSDDVSLKPPLLPEQYNGLGYQNLISMAFRLMSFRDEWMQVGKVGKRATAKSREGFSPAPLHLVLVEEPEAHLHAQVQQVFIRQSYKILRKHDDLGDNAKLITQLVVSTHSSHIAHECAFSSLRYFRRRPPINNGEVPTSTVVNLSEVFGGEGKTDRFVSRYLRATHCDLFFADAAILVEGPAERMLVPHFIRQHFMKLSHCYLTLLEIGGRHAHRFRTLIEHIGLTTLIITDLDAAEVKKSRLSATCPKRDRSLVTGNTTLRTWCPKEKSIDVLLDLEENNKIKTIDEFSSIRVAYQCPINVQLNKGSTASEALSNTFEDALVFDNLELFRSLHGLGLIKKFREAIVKASTIDTIVEAITAALKEGKKAELALELLYLADPAQLKMPTYISEGLTWLQDQMKRKQQEVVEPSESLIPEQKGLDS